jgi:hypothetical protein
VTALSESVPPATAKTWFAAEIRLSAWPVALILTFCPRFTTKGLGTVMVPEQAIVMAPPLATAVPSAEAVHVDSVVPDDAMGLVN